MICMYFNEMHRVLRVAMPSARVMSACVEENWVLLCVELRSLGVKRQMRVQSWDEATIFHRGQYRTRAE